jgi:hypothetical protein
MSSDSKKMAAGKVDLTVLKRLVSELESELAAAEGIKTDVNADRVEWVITLNKATGLAAGILTESGLLMGDIQQLISGGPQVGSPDKDFLNKLLGGLKGPGNAN